MELGISMFGDLHIDSQGKIQQAADRLEEMMTEIKAMDELGLDFFGIGEHHRPEYAVSTPEMILAAAASITTNIKLGSAVSVLSSTDPVRLFQNFATLDLLSRGRAELMAGRGSFTESFPLYGYDLFDYDELFEEKLKLLLLINTERKISWKGKFRAELVNQEIYPRPLHDTLPIWIAVGGTPQSVQRAALLGLPIIFAIIGGSPVQFKPLFQFYKETYLNAGFKEENMQVGVHMHGLFGDDNDKIGKDYFPLYAAQMNRIGAKRGWAPYQLQQFEAGRGAGGALLIGNASEAIDKILEIHEWSGITRFAAHMDVGAPSHATLMRSIEIMGNSIAPAIRKALK